MKIELDPKHDLTSSLFFLIRTYTTYEVILKENVIFDKKQIKESFKNTPVEKYIDTILANTGRKAVRDYKILLEKFSDDFLALKNVFYSLLFTEKKFINKLKKVIKKETQAQEVSDCNIGYFEEIYLNDIFVEQFNKLMKPVETCRFPPEPSGLLHLGHVKAALLNNSIADNLIVRFDDTNQDKGSEIFEKIILEDIKLLELQDFKLSRTSNFYHKIVECAEKLLSQGLAYCDDTEREQMNCERMNGIASARRESSISENIKIFNKMKENGFKQVEKSLNTSEYEKYCVRAKISIDSKNKSLRDPVIFRLKTQIHPFAKSRLSPTYDFACPVVDSLEGITTVLRTNEYRDRNEQYKWMLKKLNMRIPKIKDFSRLNFENTILSKRKLKILIEQNNLTWDDPRIPTIRGITRLGLHINVLKDYIQLQGMKQTNNIASWDKIWAMNKKYLDKISPRYTAIREKDHVKMIFVNEMKQKIQPFDEILKIPLIRKDPESQNKEVFTTNMAISKEDADILIQGEEFTLMNLGNAILTDRTKSTITCIYNPTGDFKKTKNKITWISLNDAISHNLTTYHDLLVDSEFNPDSKESEKILVEMAEKNVRYGEIIQFERIAFCRKDAITQEYIVVPFTSQKRKESQ